MSMVFLRQEIIRKKRDGLTLSGGEIGDCVSALTVVAVSEGQIGAFALVTFRS